MRIPEPRIPDDLPPQKTPSLLKNWFLGSRARAWLSRRRFVTVTGLLPPGEGARALDVGCGWGYNLFLLSHQGYEGFGIDIVQDDFEAAVRIAKANRADPRLAGADMSRLPFESQKFRAVTAVETFEHIFFPDRALAVREAARILEPGGRLVLSTPNYYSLVEFGKRIIVRFPPLKKIMPGMCYPVGDVSREDYHPYSYHRPSPAREIKSLLESEGFRVEKMKRIIFILKNTPDFLFPLCRLGEAILERLPLLRNLGSTLVVVARKRQSRTLRRR